MSSNSSSCSISSNDCVTEQEQEEIKEDVKHQLEMFIAGGFSKNL